VAETGLPSKGRIEALTDGIFAVAMTLLVLDLRLPQVAGELSDAGLREALIGLLPKLESYVISFLVLCIFWLGHHRLMHQVRGVDHRFLWRNLLFILFITFVPFTTSLMGEHRDLDDAPLVYGVNLALILAAQFLMWQPLSVRVRHRGRSGAVRGARLALRGVPVPAALPRRNDAAEPGARALGATGRLGRVRRPPTTAGISQFLTIFRDAARYAADIRSRHHL
jgi:uncharacterized membrane protein